MVINIATEQNACFVNCMYMFIDLSHLILFIYHCYDL